MTSVACIPVQLHKDGSRRHGRRLLFDLSVFRYEYARFQKISASELPPVYAGPQSLHSIHHAMKKFSFE